MDLERPIMKIEVFVENEEVPVRKVKSKVYVVICVMLTKLSRLKGY